MTSDLSLYAVIAGFLWPFLAQRVGARRREAHAAQAVMRARAEHARLQRAIGGAPEIPAGEGFGVRIKHLRVIEGGQSALRG